MHQVFFIKEEIKFGWEKVKQHSRLVFMIVLTIFAVNVAQSIVQKVLEHTGTGVVASIVLGTVGFILGVGATSIMLRLARNEHATYSDILPPWSLAWKYFLASVLVGLIVIGGLILLIVPGIYFALRFSMACYAVLDGADVTDSLRISTKLTEGVKWHLLGFVAVMILLNIVGILALGVGLLVTAPITMLAFAHVYIKLKNRHHVHAHSTN